jgi:hypothetical protein
MYKAGSSHPGSPHHGASKQFLVVALVHEHVRAVRVAQKGG